MKIKMAWCIELDPFYSVFLPGPAIDSRDSNNAIPARYQKAYNIVHNGPLVPDVLKAVVHHHHVELAFDFSGLAFKDPHAIPMNYLAADIRVGADDVTKSDIPQAGDQSTAAAPQIKNAGRS